MTSDRSDRSDPSDRSDEDEDDDGAGDVLYDLAARSAHNRADPIAMLRAFLQRFWQDNTPEEALSLWRRQVASGRWWAEDALYCLREVVSAPPANLGDLLRDDGWVLLDGQDPADWLRSTVDRLQGVMNEVGGNT